MGKLVLSLLALAAAAWPAYPGFGVFGGTSIPAGQMGSPAGFDMGASALLGGCFRVATSDLGDVEIAAAYHPRHRPKGFTPSAAMTESKMTITPITIGTNGTFALAGAFGFRLGVGAGFYIMKWLEKGTAEVDGQTYPFERTLEIDRAGFYLCLGPVLQLQGFAFEVTGRFHYVIDEDEYDYAYKVGGPPLPVKYNKDYHDMFTDVVVGVNYYFL